MDNKEYLDHLYYDIGKGKDTLKVAKADDEKGKKKWSVWRSYADVQEYKEALEEVNYRTLLKNEIVLEHDTITSPDVFDSVFEETWKDLMQNKLKFVAYYRSPYIFRIHLFFEGLDVLEREIRVKIRKALITKYRCDMQKSGDNTRIELETAPDWKTKKPPIEKKNIGDGINDNLEYLFAAIKETVEREDLNALRISFVDDKKRGRHYIAEKLIKTHSFKTICGKKDETIYIYNEGIYEPTGEGKIKEEVENILEEDAITYQVNEIINKIKRKTIEDRELLDNADLNLLCLNNCILDIDTMKTIPHSPEYIFLNKIPVDYDASQDCPKIKKLLEELLYEEDVPLVQEYIGYMLYRKYFIKRAMMFVGETDTGKTTLLNTIIKFLEGDNTGINKNIAGESLHKITTDKFSAVNLYGKYANIYDELEYKDIVDNGAFKIATGGGYVTGDIKFGDTFKFRTYAKLLFATNKIPNMKDVDDEATYTRWQIVRFNNRFSDNNPKTEKFLVEKITTKEEMQGLLNFAIVGLKRILKNQKFCYSKSWEENRKIMQRSGNSVSSFAQDAICEKSNHWITKEEMYQRYCMYVRKECMSRVTKEKIGRDLPQYATYLIETKKDVGKKKKVRGWLHVSFRESQKKLEEEPKKTKEKDMKTLLFDYISENEGVSLLDVLEKYEGKYSEADIIAELERKEKEKKIVSRGGRYFLK